MSLQTIDSNRPADVIWPPPPQMCGSGVWVSRKIPITPEMARHYFFTMFFRYGIEFGAMYGSVTGLFFLIIGAIFGMPIGGILGCALGFIDGLILAALAYYMVRNGTSVPAIAHIIRIIAPLTTMLGESILLMTIGQPLGGTMLLKSWFIATPCFIAIIASAHAAWYVTKEFMETYE